MKQVSFRRHLVPLVGIVLGVLVGFMPNLLPKDLPDLLQWIEGREWTTFLLIAAIFVVVSGWQLFSGEESLNKVNETPAMRDRRILIANVRSSWIAGVLDRPLFNELRLQLPLLSDTGAVLQPPQVQAEIAGQPSQKSVPQTVLEAYDQYRSLLLLGAPGGGKTTQLLELADTLLKRAEQEETTPIPVVLSLTTWANTQKPLAQWLIDELHQRYAVPREQGAAWIGTISVTHPKLVLLLDGLDEVDAAVRLKCVEAINNFHGQVGIPLVVCSRLEEYQAIAAQAKLDLRSDVRLLAPKEQDVHAFLAKLGKPLEGLRAALVIDNDEYLKYAVKNPFLLNVMILGYRGKAADEILGLTTIDERRRHIVDTYIRTVLHEPLPLNDKANKQSKIIPAEISLLQQRLQWLARAMRAERRTVFYVEELQPTLLHSWVKKAFFSSSLSY